MADGKIYGIDCVACLFGSNRDLLLFRSNGTNLERNQLVLVVRLQTVLDTFIQRNVLVRQLLVVRSAAAVLIPVHVIAKTGSDFLRSKE